MSDEEVQHLPGAVVRLFQLSGGGKVPTDRKPLQLTNKTSEEAEVEVGREAGILRYWYLH